MTVGHAPFAERIDTTVYCTKMCAPTPPTLEKPMYVKNIQIPDFLAPCGKAKGLSLRGQCSENDLQNHIDYSGP
jgi:hypothetical protein